MIAAGYVVFSGGGVSQLTAEGGFTPKGGVAILSGIVIVIFAFVGAEIATIAAAESDEPGESVRKATNSVIVRVLTFYVLSVFLIVAILPWNSAELGKSPFAATLGRDRHPGRRAGHERDRADGGALVPELGALRGLADELRAGAAR